MKTLLQRYDKANKIKKILIIVAIVGISLSMFLPMLVTGLSFVFDLDDVFDNLMLISPTLLIPAGIAVVLIVVMVLPRMGYVKGCKRLITQGRGGMLDVPVSDNPAYASSVGYNLYLDNGLVYTNRFDFIIPVDDIKNVFGIPNTRNKGIAKLAMSDELRNGMKTLDKECFLVIVAKDGFRACTGILSPHDAKAFLDTIMDANPEITWGKLGNQL